MIFREFPHKKHLERIFSMQNNPKPSVSGSLTPDLEGAPSSASHENRSIPVILPTQDPASLVPGKEASPSKP